MKSNSIVGLALAGGVLALFFSKRSPAGEKPAPVKYTPPVVKPLPEKPAPYTGPYTTSEDVVKITSTDVWIDYLKGLYGGGGGIPLSGPADSQPAYTGPFTTTADVVAVTSGDVWLDYMKGLTGY